MDRRGRIVIITLAIMVLLSFFGGWLLGKSSAYKEIAEHPFSCVPGQIVNTPTGRYFCAEAIEWKQERPGGQQ